MIESSLVSDEFENENLECIAGSAEYNTFIHEIEFTDISLRFDEEPLLKVQPLVNSSDLSVTDDNLVVLNEVNVLPLFTSVDEVDKLYHLILIRKEKIARMQDLAETNATSDHHLTMLATSYIMALYTKDSSLRNGFQRRARQYTDIAVPWLLNEFQKCSSVFVTQTSSLNQANNIGSESNKGSNNEERFSKTSRKYISYLLGIYYLSHFAGEKEDSYQNGIHYLQLAINDGYYPAMHELALFYLTEGHTSKATEVKQKDLMKEGFELLLKVASPPFSYIPAICKLASCYEKGSPRGICEKNLFKAIEYLQVCVKENDSYGIHRLAVLYEKKAGERATLSSVSTVSLDSAPSTKGFSTSENNEAVESSTKPKKKGYILKEALRLYHMAADLGNPLSAFSLATYYDKGIYKSLLPQSYEKAFYFYSLCCMNSPSPSPSSSVINIGFAQNRLSFLYEKGLGGCLKNEEKALEWIEKSAKNNDFLSQNTLGSYYEKGYGMKQPDRKEALKWYLKSAKQGYSIGQYNVARYYLEELFDENKKKYQSNGEKKGTTSIEQETNDSNKTTKSESTSSMTRGSTTANVGTAAAIIDPMELQEGLKWLRLCSNQGEYLAQKNLFSCYRKLKVGFISIFPWLGLKKKGNIIHNLSDEMIDKRVIEKEIRKWYNLIKNRKEMILRNGKPRLMSDSYVSEHVIAIKKQKTNVSLKRM
jgi:TPR repeat protein